MENQDKNQKIKKVSIICAKGNLEDVYAALVLANGAVMDGLEAKLFFTFFGLDAVIKKRMNKLQTATVGNPALRMPNGSRMPKLLGLIPGVQNMVSSMMKKQMDELDVPPVDEFFDMITAGGGEIYACQLAVDMFKVKKEDLSEHVLDILTVGEFYEKASGESSQIIFT
jgi:peroxiredoxin family protein